MARDSKPHPWSGKVVHFGTCHGKSRALRGPLKAIGIECVTARIQTDAFGTFSGSVPRTASIREALQAKVEQVFLEFPRARFALASEGSFGPHPHFGIPSDHEALLLRERGQAHEIFVDHLSTEVHHFELRVNPGEDPKAAIQKTRFPSHALCIRLEGDPLPFQSAIRTQHRLEEALRNITRLPGPPRALLISADLRAHLNPTRMEVIRQTGKKLIERITSLCPACDQPGFWPERPGPGVPCVECGEASHTPSGYHWACGGCGATEYRSDPLAPSQIPSGKCINCNP